MIPRSDFQAMVNGKETDLFVLQNNSGLKASVTNYGGRLVSLETPDKEGIMENLIVGYKTIDDFINGDKRYFGAIIGRYANRIKDGKFQLDGKCYFLATNNGPNHLHGGPGGFHTVVWDGRQLNSSTVRLTYHSADGEEGYPGSLDLEVLYQLRDSNELLIEYRAETDQKTIINLTNHAYFNLAGLPTASSVHDFEMMINADYFTPVDSNLIPTGERSAVKGTPFDFTQPRKIGERIHEKHPQLELGDGYDHNYVLNKTKEGGLSLAARVKDPASGRVMEVHTTEPGMQFYECSFSEAHEGIIKAGSAFCLETQHFPDSPNHPGFPSVVLEPGEQFYSASRFVFGTE